MTRITGAEAKRLREAVARPYSWVCDGDDAALIAAAPALALAVEELERERDEALAELAAERGAYAGGLPGWRIDDNGEWVNAGGGLVRREGMWSDAARGLMRHATAEHGCPMWQWYADAADEGDPSQTAPTARAAMRAADAAAKARTP